MRWVDLQDDPPEKVGVVLSAEVVNTGPIDLRVEGELWENVPRLSSYSPVRGDRVLVLVQGEFEVVIGKVVS